MLTTITDLITRFSCFDRAYDKCILLIAESVDGFLVYHCKRFYVDVLDEIVLVSPSYMVEDRFKSCRSYVLVNVSDRVVPEGFEVDLVRTDGSVDCLQIV